MNLFLAFAFSSALLVLGSLLKLLHPEAATEGFFMPFAEVRVRGVPESAGWITAAHILKMAVAVNLSLFFLNLLPIPPLDGFGVLESLAPRSMARPLAALRRAGWVIFLALIALGAIDFLLIYPTIYGLGFLLIILSLVTGLG